MCRRVLASVATCAILFGAIMLASRADAITLAVPSGLRAAAATTDVSQPIQYYCGSGWGYGGYGDAGYGYSGYGGGGYGYSGYGYGGYPAYGYGYGGPYYGYGGYSRPYYGYGGYPGWGYRVRWW
jgi:hypothetical protein